jgi:hypothetical protein
MVLTVEPPSSNPPAEGPQRTRPLNTPSSSGESKLRIKEDKPSPPTKSPDSQQVLKWARFTSPGLEAHVDAPFLVPITLPLSSSTHQPPSLRLPEEPAPSTPSPPTTSHDVPVDQLKHLESLVDSVLAAVDIIQAATSQPVILSPHPPGELLSSSTHLSHQPLPPPAWPRPSLSHGNPPCRLMHRRPKEAAPLTHQWRKMSSRHQLVTNPHATALVPDHHSNHVTLPIVS